MKINKSQSYFWHWFCVCGLHMKPHDYKNLYKFSFTGKHESPFMKTSIKGAGIETRWDAARFFRERVRRDKHCPVYQYPTCHY